MKFGHDIANIICRMVWLSNIGEVNSDYHARIFCHRTTGYLCVKDQHFTLNVRHSGYRQQILHHDLTGRCNEVFMVGVLPKYYWEIKELY